ncbi:MAG: lipoprotein signal peptidase [Gammaproteobacteria bacterium]|jgi:signal peptidase II|nr:lipoprotein signal peptidase [Gammaproteobacteria bacterium]MBT5204710.1 lipoprotein signal peptidase [Gammaproteobacteria bacterium]MBT5602697.1 lipoprotein signal peptidase [Gammaproteobacteria bacterium]MBT6246082.1 lipoprotein signal peptidase [Gammaproteobacteria bacterium]
MHYLLSFTIVVVDQISKQLMERLLDLCVPGHCQSIVLLPVFELALVHNEGAAFSFLSEAGGWQRWFLALVSLIASVFICFWIFQARKKDIYLSWALALILGGAVGNLVDRVGWGYVIDFFIVHYQHYYFPAFNVADAAISVGAVMVLIDMFANTKSRTDEH